MSASQAAFQFPGLETPRLFLRILTLHDAESVYRHFSDDEVTRFMDMNSCTCRQDARDIIDFHLKDPGCRWGLFDKEAGVLVGTCGYHCWVKNEAMSMAEIGYDLGKAYWGQGLMRETLQTAILFGFEKMKLIKIHASVKPENHRSIKMLISFGFRPETAFRDGLQWFNLFKEDWNACTTTSRR